MMKLVEYFVVGSTARTAADVLGINKNTAAKYFSLFREIIAEKIEDNSPVKGEIEVDESYFGGKRKGKRGRGAGGKVPVFGLLKRKENVYTKVVADTKSSSLLPIISKKVMPDSLVYSDTYKSYNALDVSQFRHERINHSKLFADKENHINGIENFWSQAKRHLRRFNGVPKSNFNLYLKECEWRFNFGPPSNLMKILIKWVKQSTKIRA